MCVWLAGALWVQQAAVCLWLAKAVCLWQTLSLSLSLSLARVRRIRLTQIQ